MMHFSRIKMRLDQDVCTITFDRPESKNTIDALLVDELSLVLDELEGSAKVIVLDHAGDFFCNGADFSKFSQALENRSHEDTHEPEKLYQLWQRLCYGPFITIAHVKGVVNAGGVGFVAACDLVISDRQSQFSLSELLFGLYPACVLPFLIKRIGYQKAHQLTLLTKAIDAEKAYSISLIDSLEDNSERELKMQLRRLRCIPKQAIKKYKQYMEKLNDLPTEAKELAISANKDIFSDPKNRQGITEYVKTGQLPWETSAHS